MQPPARKENGAFILYLGQNQLFVQNVQTKDADEKKWRRIKVA